MKFQTVRDIKFPTIPSDVEENEKINLGSGRSKRQIQNPQEGHC